MRAQNWTDIMTLLAVMVVATKMDEKTERLTFEQAALYLRDMVAPNVTLTNTFARDWMIENRTDIERQTTSVHYDATVKRLVKNLEVLSNKDEILSEIMKWTLTDKRWSKRVYRDVSIRQVPMGNLFRRHDYGVDLAVAS